MQLILVIEIYIKFLNQRPRNHTHNSKFIANICINIYLIITLSNNKRNFLLYQINSKNHKNRNVYVRTAKHKLRLFANNMRVIKKFKIKNNPKRYKRELNFCCCNLDIDIHYFYTFLIRIIRESLLFKKRASRNICVFQSGTNLTCVCAYKK